MNIDLNSATPMKYGIRSIPTLLVFKNGEVVDKIVGAVPKVTIEDKIKNQLA
jgi:thioredoxin 1